MKTNTSAARAKVEARTDRLLTDEALRFITGGAKVQPAKKFTTSTLRFDPYKSYKFR